MGDFLSVQLFTAGQVATAPAFAEALTSPEAVAIFETSLALNGESHADLEALLEGHHRATDIKTRQAFLNHVAKWVHHNGPKIEKTLGYIRRHFISSATPFAPREVWVNELLNKLRGQRADTVHSGLSQRLLPPQGLKLASGDNRTGPRLEVNVQPTLKLSQSLRLQQELRFKPSVLSGIDYYRSVYDRAKKLRITISELELDFEVALISRFDLPEMAHMGEAGLMVAGLNFVVEDFFADLDGPLQDLFIKLVAAHMHGEVVFNDHQMATRLELAIAKHLNVLEIYLQFLEKKCI